MMLKRPESFKIDDKEYDVVDSPTVGCIGCAFEGWPRDCIAVKAPNCTSTQPGNQFVVIFVERKLENELV